MTSAKIADFGFRIADCGLKSVRRYLLRMAGNPLEPYELPLTAQKIISIIRNPQSEIRNLCIRHSQ
ncbi:MAG TPA: hypothetical protein VGQ81_10395 [Acidobacteriota bacterium]|nr:hypothetical protein [Acidobacteriota bacterium]